MEGASFYGRSLSGPMSGVGFPSASSLTPPPAAPYYPPQQTPPFYHQPATMENHEEKLDKILKILDSQGKAIDDLRSDVEKMKEKQESGSLNTSTSFPAKTTLPSEISLAVKHLHEKSSAVKQFKGSQKYDSKHNQDVMDYFIDVLSQKFSPKYSPKKIKSLIQI